MKIAHLADLHLGYRAYNRTANGINVRERDVGAAFAYAVDRVLDIQPDVIVIAGDVFHSPRPSNTAMAFAMVQFSRLSSLGVPIILTSGNHDQPATVETGDPLEMLRAIPNVKYLSHNGDSVTYDGVEFQAYPTGSGLCITPRKHPRVAIWHEAPPPWDWAKDYDLILMGHYHVRDQPLPNAYYPGSLERCSSNIWIEESPKGFNVYDWEPDSGINWFDYIPVPSRPMHDLLPIPDAKSLTPDELSAAIRMRLDAVPGGIAGKIIRLVIRECPSSLIRAVDHKMVREARSEALHFQIDARRPIPGVKTASAEREGKSLDEVLKEYLMHQFQPSDASIDRNRVLELAQHYMGLVKEDVTATETIYGPD